MTNLSITERTNLTVQQPRFKGMKVGPAEDRRRASGSQKDLTFLNKVGLLPTTALAGTDAGRFDEPAAGMKVP